MNILSGKIFRLLFLSAAIFSILFTADYLRADTDTGIIMYGSKNCGLCTAMQRNLDAEKIPYQFLDVKEDAAKNSEMWAKIFKAHGRLNSVRFPVMDINGEILVSPKFEDVKAKLKTSQKTSDGGGAAEAVSTESVEIYGDGPSKKTNDICLTLIHKGVNFTYTNLKNNIAGHDALAEKILSQYQEKKTIEFPVVILNGRILISPAAEEVSNYLMSNKSQKIEIKPVKPKPINRKFPVK
jgi:glutaredoxin